MYSFIYYWDNQGEGYPSVDAASWEEAVEAFAEAYAGGGRYVNPDKVYVLRNPLSGSTYTAVTHPPTVVKTADGWMIDGPRRAAPLAKRGERACRR